MGEGRTSNRVWNLVMSGQRETWESPQIEDDATKPGSSCVVEEARGYSRKKK